MKRNYIILLVVEVILLLFLVFNIFISGIFTYTNINYVLLWIITLTTIITMVGLKKDKHIYKLDVMQMIFIYSISYLILTYILGLFFGFMKSPYSSELINIIKNMTPILIILVCQELIRYIIISKSKEKKRFIVILIMLFALFDITLGVSSYDLSSGMEVFEFIAILVLPSIVTNTLLTYVSYHSGYKPTIMYRLILEATVYLLPLFPDLGIYLKSVLEIVFPLFIFLGVNSFYARAQIGYIRDNKLSKLLFWIPVSSLLLVMVILTSGLFKVYSLAIGSGSMEPNVKVGDAVIIEKLDKEQIDELKVDDIIVYAKENRVVVHRISSIFYEDGKKVYKTKGDNNDAPDNYIVKENEIKGIVHYKIPLIGYPAVWLSSTSK